MPEADTIHPEELPHTIESLAADLAACGLTAGQTVLVHTRMSALGWVVGGAKSIIHALLQVLTPSGTLMMPAFSPDNTDPRYWQNPPVPEHWWPIIRAHMPPYDPLTTPTRGIGHVAELFRRWPGVLRSAHPDASFAALGPEAAYLTGQPMVLDQLFGEDSALGRLYESDGYVLLLGPDHSRNTSLHLAEYRADYPKQRIREGAAVMLDGRRQWLEYEMIDFDDSDFAALGADFEKSAHMRPYRIGRADVRLMRQRPLVDFAVKWMEEHRQQS